MARRRTLEGGRAGSPRGPQTFDPGNKGAAGRRWQGTRFAEILGLEDIKNNSGRVVQEAPLELWANVKQRALDQALRKINKHSDIRLELEFIGRGAYRKVQSLGFRITATKQAKR